MHTELFPPEVVAVPSPRLAWIKKHALVLDQPRRGGSECPETGDDIPIWVCRKRVPLSGNHWSKFEIGGGNTEDEACADFAKNARVLLWNEEGEFVV